MQPLKFYIFSFCLIIDDVICFSIFWINVHAQRLNGTNAMSLALVGLLDAVHQLLCEDLLTGILKECLLNCLCLLWHFPARLLCGSFLLHGFSNSRLFCLGCFRAGSFLFLRRRLDLCRAGFFLSTCRLSLCRLGLDRIRRRYLDSILLSRCRLC